MSIQSTNPPTVASPRRGISLPIRFALGILLIFALSLWIFYISMNPPAGELGLMALYLSITAVVSGLASYAAYRLGWLYRSPTIRWTLIGIYILSSALTFMNVWFSALRMFASPHDLILANILLVFASGIAIVIGYFFASALTDRIKQIDSAAQSIAQGNLEARSQVRGRDELADLARTFNEMALQLQDAARKQRELDNLRRDLIAWVSHDLQTPLASIRLIVEALADGMVEDPGTVQRYLRTAQREIGELSSLIDDLFQMAQLDAGGLDLEIADNSLSDLISDTLESFGESANRQEITLLGEIENGVDPVRMDAQRIGRVLDNLLGNAIRHTPEGGSVKVKASRNAQGVIVEVRDNGEGIPAEDLPHVFDRFYRREKSRNRITGGAGLGLAIARGIVEAHSGQIEVESTPGQGTCFRITIPG